jgi:hypothetical protein
MKVLFSLQVRLCFRFPEPWNSILRPGGSACRENRNENHIVATMRFRTIAICNEDSEIFKKKKFPPANPLPITFSKESIKPAYPITSYMNEKKEEEEEEEEEENYLTANVTRLQTLVYKTNQAGKIVFFLPCEYPQLWDVLRLILMWQLKIPLLWRLQFLVMILVILLLQRPRNWFPRMCCKGKQLLLFWRSGWSFLWL